MAIDPLIEVSEFVRREVSAGEKVAVIFDLDSTLFCVSPRTQAILRKLGGEREFAAANAELSEILQNVEVLPTDWGIKSVLERSRAPGTMEVFKEVRNFWRKHFFANHFLEHDTIYPSANEYVKHLAAMGADILYLTGRNQGSMFEGTVKMLKRWGFPYHEGCLYMKPSDVQTDEGFKAEELARIAPDYRHIWFFENEPLIIGLVRERLPAQVRIVFVDSVHSGRAAAPSDLPTIGMSYASGVVKK